MLGGKRNHIEPDQAGALFYDAHQKIAYSQPFMTNTSTACFQADKVMIFTPAYDT